MDLQGKIEKFNVPDIFQLISSGKRTGTLGIVRNNQATMFYFKDGQITYAYSPANHGKIGERLVDKGFINQKMLEQSLEQQKFEKGQNRLGKILLENKSVNDQQLATILAEQISDIVFKVMAWDRGLFKFYDNTFPTVEDQSLALSTESLILAGAQKADELSHLKDELPDFGKSLRLKQIKAKNELRLATDQWNILTYCDGRRTIDELIEQISDDTSAALKSIQSFLKDGLIEAVDNNLESNQDITRLELQVESLAELLNKFLQKA